jgi:hypothetical protein
MLYHRLFREAEEVRWRVADVPWDQIDSSAVDDNLLFAVRSAIEGELGTFGGTRQFMDLFESDGDFTQWLAVWFYEETKHPHVLALWLEHVAGEPVESAAIASGHQTTRFSGSRAATLASNFIAEVMAAQAYLALARYSPEPVLTHIATRLAGDEARHASHFYSYLRKELAKSPKPMRDTRKILIMLDMWLREASALVHPVKTKLADAREAMNIDELPVGGAAFERKVCRMFGHLIGDPSVSSHEDVRSLLRERSVL